MAYEEASVAGETPDRSKQRKSSGKPTEAEPPVPAPEERDSRVDPRLAVAREVPAARADQATAVFSTRGAVVDGGEGEEGEDETSEGSEASEASEASAASETPETSEAAEGNGDARLRAAVAAWVATAEEAPEGPEAGSEPEAEPAAASDDAVSSDAEADTADEESSSDAADAEVDSDSDADTADVEAEAPDSDSDAEPEADVAEAESEPEADVADEESATDTADDEVEASSDEDSTTADAESDTSEDSEDSEDSDVPEPADADDKTPASPVGTGTGGVDQATAVFKALPPKAVDQPTTMLKLGDHKPPAKKAEGKAPAKPEAKPEAKPAAKSEAEAERTSKFVALKSLDNAPPRSGSSSTPLPPAKAPTPDKAHTPEKPGSAGSVGPERTTQQPLPPRPPLDLLAELTNTPPPPETRVRTAVRRVKVWTPLVLLLVIVFAVVQAVRPLPTPTLTLTAQETASFEGGKPSMPWPGQGQAAMDVNGIGSFGTSGKQKPVPIASIAKVMTVYLILRDHPLKKGGDDGPNIPVDAAAQKHYETGKAENESVVKVTEGQKIREYEALQAVMLPSANNIAKLLARWDTKSDSEDEFVAKMNKTAKELGMKDTHYTDPSGLDKTTVSTAADLVKLGRAAMEDPVFNEISRQPSYKDLNGDKQNNFFGLVPTVAIGIKTGTTTAAGGNILFAAEKKIGGETRTIIGAALGQYGQNGTANIDEVTGVTRKLIEAGQGALTAKTIVKKGDVVGEVDDGLGGTTPVVATKDVAAAGWPGLTVKLKLGEDGGETIPHSAKAGTKVGVLSVGDGKEGAVEVPVALQKDLTEPGFGAKLQRVG